MKIEELKPCPRCGCIPELSVLNHKEITVEIRCKNCSIRLIQKYRYFSRDEAIKLTIASWNSRPIEDALRKRVEELEAENAKMRHYICFGCQMKDHETTCETCNFAEKKGGGE